MVLIPTSWLQSLESKTMNFDNIQTCEEWWQVDRTGKFHAHSSPRDALLSGGTMLSACRIGDKTVAVFLDQDLSEAKKSIVAASRPSEIDTVIYAASVPGTEAGTAVMNVDIGHLGSVGIEGCAVAASFAANSAGSFKVEPVRYRVHMGGDSAVDVTLLFDQDTELWSAEARDSTSTS
jgi:hypothetical protein